MEMAHRCFMDEFYSSLLPFGPDNVLYLPLTSKTREDNFSIRTKFINRPNHISTIKFFPL